MIVAHSRMPLRDFMKLNHLDDLDDHQAATLMRIIHVLVLHHDGQKRQSGEDYDEHLMATYLVIKELGFPFYIQAAALLHDSIEDCVLIDYNFLQANFKPPEIADLVRGITKYNPKTYFDQMRRDITILGHWEILPLKGSDRLHNLATVNGFTDIDRRVRFCEETLGPLCGLYHDCRSYVPTEYSAAVDELYNSVMVLAKSRRDENLAAKKLTMADLMSASP